MDLLSLLVAFLGDKLDVMAARSSGSFSDVPSESDLCTTVLLEDTRSGAVGTAVASRVSIGSGDLLELELRGEKGCLRLSTEHPDILQVYMSNIQHEWRSINCGNEYQPISGFPSSSSPSGWLRSLIHAHYLFFGGTDEYAFIPDLKHALTVQRLIHQVSEHLANIRNHSRLKGRLEN
ncbi:hypothetical protein KFU94_03860 [Chloroflexi bacterium TSY]|nr:hypothetical protein [Chloroflexi bacterium TSY]